MRGQRQVAGSLESERTKRRHDALASSVLLLLDEVADMTFKICDLGRSGGAAALEVDVRRGGGTGGRVVGSLRRLNRALCTDEESRVKV